MLTIQHSNSLDVLKIGLMNALSSNMPKNPFVNEQVLVQCPSLGQWLKQEIALSFGITASIQFSLPSSFIWNIFHAFFSTSRVSSFSRETVVWKIMHVLPSLLDDTPFISLKEYLDVESSLSHDRMYKQLRLYQLSTKIADVFDQYLVYRPDWMKSWEEECFDVFQLKDHAWQPLLWKKIVDITLKNDQTARHRSYLYDQLITVLKQKNLEEKYQFPFNRIFVFGITGVPSSYLNLFELMSQHIDVYLFFQNPCKEYWEDVGNYSIVFSDQFLIEEKQDLRLQNALLDSMGHVGRDSFSLLNKMNIDQEICCFIDPLLSQNNKKKTMLHHVQSHILHFKEPLHPIIYDDESIHINSCHSILREVEVLHDYLLDQFAKNPLLNPRDIVIMVPDIEEYYSIIQAVFSSMPSERSIPFVISDYSVCSTHPILEVFLKIFQCHQGNYTVSDLISILEVSSIMRRYSLNVTQLEAIKNWISQAEIRCNISSDSQQLLLYLQEYNTWQYGLERMLLGYVIGQKDSMYNGVASIENIEGSHALSCGLLIDFVRSIHWLSVKLNEERTPEEWITFIYQIIQRFFELDDKEEEIISIIYDTLHLFYENTQNAYFDKKISHAVMLEWLTAHIKQKKENRNFLNGKVNVCTLIPLRSIPFQIVCLLGMNNDTYPRSSIKHSFDLMSFYPRQGDRSYRHDDCYLFLEALLAAQKKFYISYIGHNIYDDSECAPSFLLAELIDYCETHFIDKNKKKVSLVKQHALQAFNSMYFKKKSLLFSYAKEWMPPCLSVKKKTDTSTLYLMEQQKITSISLEDFLSFYSNPSKFFVKKRFGISFKELPSSIEDNEPFQSSALQNFYFRKKWIDHQRLCQKISPLTYEKWLLFIKSSGFLPQGPMKELSLSSLLGESELLWNDMKSYIQGISKNCYIDLSIDDYRLTGWISGIYPEGLFRYRPSRRKESYLVSSFIEFLCLCAMKHHYKLHFFHLPSYTSKSNHISLSPFSSKQSIQHIKVLLDYFTQGINHPLPFFPQSSLYWVHYKYSKDKKKHGEEIAMDLKKKRELLSFFLKEQKNDEYIYRLWNNTSEEFLVQSIIAVAEQVLKPLEENQNK